jgi:ATP-dependent protease Clp ATPase subunit
MDIMFDIPSMTGVEKCVITRDVIFKGKPPIYESAVESKRASA